MLRVAIVGPGRVGRALGRRLAAAGVQLLGFVGRTQDSASAAVAFAGAGRVLAPGDLVGAHVVVFSVGDADLVTAIAAARAATGNRPCGLWLHTSGRFDLGVFDGVEGIRRGALHPVLPFPSAEHGAAHLAGAPAVLMGEPRSRRLLLRLAERLGMVPVWRDGGDPVLYHAGCALAANGLTALYDLVQRCLVAAGGLEEDGRRRVADSLLRAAAAACAESGPVAALSGPVRRGDAATVQAHRAALAAGAPAALPTYLALMRAALDLAIAAGLPGDRAAAVQGALGQEMCVDPPSTA
ncbi:MAG: DUF2520 domain-containing protein [Planctomycetes bacterium]|nr:DUF2520 domain-containing protein [Planctomycetota bacterium]